jgi:ABC-type multidrug transport system ATPase subunit
MSVPNPVIQAASLSKSFGSKKVIANLDFSIGAGTVFGLVGLNGAGKTTLIRVLLGLLKPTAGSIKIMGFEPWKHEAAYFRKLGVLLENDGFFPNLSVRANIDFYAAAKGVSREKTGEYLSRFWGDQEILQVTRQVKHLSRGQRMQCALCRAFLGSPAVCFLDEPTIALDHKAYDHFCGLVRDARAGGATVLISSHQFSAIEDLCDTVWVLEDGAIREIESAKSANSFWRIDTDNSEAASQIIANLAGGKPEYERNSWRFPVLDSVNSIPAIVRELSNAGCPVRMVKPESNDLGETIRKLYA